MRRLLELARVYQRAHEHCVARFTREPCRRHLPEQRLDHARLAHAQCHRTVVDIARRFGERRLVAIEQRALRGDALVAGRELLRLVQPF